MIATFAFDKNTSPVNVMPGANVKRHEPAQYMSLCQFNNIYWGFDKSKNYAPYLIFDGEVERLDAIDTKFPGNVDTVYFTESKPSVQFRYDLDEDQMADLAKKGFWSGNGVNVPSLFTSAKFQLETYACVEEVVNKRQDPRVPIFNIELIKPYENSFDSSAYELISKVTRRKPEESKTIENIVQIDMPQSVADEIEAVKAVMEEQQRSAQVAGEHEQPTPEELDQRAKMASINASVEAERNRLKQARDGGNAKAEAERAAEQARIIREREAFSQVYSKNESVEAGKSEPENETKADPEEIDNLDIFADSNSADDAEMPDKAVAFMKRLNGSADKAQNSDEKKDDKRDSSGSGAASGVQGLGVYTFEDQSTAQFEVRADEGKGNEKSDSDEESDDVASEDTKSEPLDVNERKTKLTAVINNTQVDSGLSDDKGERSK